MADPLTPAEIYSVARAAGFSPDQAVTMTAIALAESGGNPDAANTDGENSLGLWQINMNADSTSAWAQGLDLYDPVDNAKAAWEVSGQGGDIRPWTVTHDDQGSRYAQFADEARQASIDNGESGLGNFDGPTNYYDDPVGAAPIVDDSIVDSVPDWSPTSPVELPSGEGSVSRFLEVALAQRGDQYISNAQTDPNDPDPDAFDCSELVEWAAAQVGAKMGEASYSQYLDLKAKGYLIPVDQAVNTPGALLFSFSEEPVPGGGRPSHAHVAISIGDGTTIEAMSPSRGVDIGQAGDRFGYAALIPGLDYANIDEVSIGALPDVSPPDPPATPAPDVDDLALAATSQGSGDTDHDMLPDHFELKYGLDPDQPDTDGDGITDGYELIVLGTKATRTDTDFDQISDDLEVAFGLDPLVADNPDASVPLLVPDDLQLDSDGDGISDWGEEVGGTDPGDPDSDDDGVLDGDELFYGSDPMQPDSA